MYRKTVSKNVEKIGKKYRCRVTIKGKRLDHYETSLLKARTWVKSMTN